MPLDFALEPKTKRAAGERCCEPVVYPDVEREQAQRMAAVAKALGDPVRLQLVDVLRKYAGKVCVCELVPLFDLSQPTVSHHLKVLRDAGLVESERQGLWAYYYVLPRSLDELAGWLQSIARLLSRTANRAVAIAPCQAPVSDGEQAVDGMSMGRSLRLNARQRGPTSRSNSSTRYWSPSKIEISTISSP